MSTDRTAPKFSSALATGATGFLGGHLCGRLASCGIKTSALIRPTSSEESVVQLKKDTTVFQAPKWAGHRSGAKYVDWSKAIH